jgi:hypothetical protein
MSEWKLMPPEATPEMIAAAVQAPNITGDYEATMQAEYRAYFRAAPPAPADYGYRAVLPYSDDANDEALRQSVRRAALACDEALEEAAKLCEKLYAEKYEGWIAEGASGGEGLLDAALAIRALKPAPA